MEMRVALPWAVAGAILVAACPAPAWAQTTSTPPTPPVEQPSPVQPASNPLGGLRFGLTFEGFYQYNWNKPFDRINLLRAYDTRANTFGIQQAALVFEFAPDVQAGRRFGGRVDLQIGQAAAAVQGSAANEPRPDVYRNLWQAYGTYVFAVGHGVQMDFGKFGSNLGYETNYAKDNNQFSRALLFDFLPFYHTGFRISVPVNDKVTLMYMLTNGVQQAEDFNNFKSSHVSAVVTPSKSMSWTTSYFAGQEQPDGGLPGGPDGFFRVFDSYVSYTATPHLALALDVNRTTNQVTRQDPTTALTGLGAYARFQIGVPGAISARYERLDDEGLIGGMAQTLQELTLTAEYKFADGFLLRGEYRRDWSNQPFFTTATPGTLQPHQNTALMGLVWWFGNKSGAY